MKKLLFALAALTAISVSCQQEALAPVNEEEKTPVIEEITVPNVIYASIADDDTKAGMDRYYDDGTSSYKYRHHWETGDLIYVYEGTSVTTYELSLIHL